MDLTDYETLLRWIETIRPGGIIHAAAISQTGRCQDRPDETEPINVTVPGRLAGICADLDIPMVFTSTDLVFDGCRPPYSETSTPRPVNVYGEQKVRAEQRVLDRWPKALVCRMPLMVGAAPNVVNNFTLQMIAAIADGRQGSLFTDEYRTPVDIWSAARGLVQFLGHRHGLLHLGGHTRISRLDIGIRVARCLGVDPFMIQGVSSAELPDAETRAQDCSLDSRRAFSMGYAPDALDQGLQRTIDQWRHLRFERQAVE